MVNFVDFNRADFKPFQANETAFLNTHEEHQKTRSFYIVFREYAKTLVWNTLNILTEKQNRETIAYITVNNLIPALPMSSCIAERLSKIPQMLRTLGFSFSIKLKTAVFYD